MLGVFLTRFWSRFLAVFSMKFYGLIINRFVVFTNMESGCLEKVFIFLERKA